MVFLASREAIVAFREPKILHCSLFVDFHLLFRLSDLWDPWRRGGVASLYEK